MQLSRSDVSTVITLVILGSVAAAVAGANHVLARRTGNAADQQVVHAPRALETSRGGLQRTIEEMQARLRDRPSDASAAAILADALLRKSRVTGDAGLALPAEAALVLALEDEPADYEARRMLATVYLAQHRFRDAIREASRLRDQRPRDDWNHGVIGDAHVELGEYDEAFAAFQKMMDLRPTAGAYARASYALELKGRIDEAIEAMTLATNAAPPADHESIAWHHAQLGDLFREAGRFDEAEREYAWAEHAFPGHPFAAAGAARLAVARGDLESAVTKYELLIAKQSSPDLVAELGDLYGRLGRPADASRQYALAEAAWRSEAGNPAQLARFLADHNMKVDEAVTLAEGAAASRRDIFTEDALAWSYFKAGRLSDAAAAIARAQRTGSRDRAIDDHAASIKQALK